jgi:hypothetical protein
MPIYEYYSPQTHKIYAFFARSIMSSDVVPLCPDGEEYPMERLVSGFAVIGRAKEPHVEHSDDMDDPRMEAAMAEMERELASMDEENPDPRQMGQLMRRMSELTGEKLPASMEEMVARLEAGEDPDKLEEEFGDLEDLENFGEGSEADAGEERTRALWRRMRKPSRDPELYEMAEYLSVKH